MIMHTKKAVSLTGLSESTLASVKDFVQPPICSYIDKWVRAGSSIRRAAPGQGHHGQSTDRGICRIINRTPHSHKIPVGLHTEFYPYFLKLLFDGGAVLYYYELMRLASPFRARHCVQSAAISRQKCRTRRLVSLWTDKEQK